MLGQLVSIAAFAAFVVAAPAPEPILEKRLNNTVGRTPAMGWNPWNVFGCGGSNANQALLVAKQFQQLGLDKVGYIHVNMDDCWQASARDSSGNLAPDPTKWPNGMKAVADEIHGMGLKLGLYGDSGSKTCDGFPGTGGHETQDAKQLAAWGIDYWKYDNCHVPTGNSQPRYTTMSKALLASGYPILFSLCNWGDDDVWTWGAGVGNSWRIFHDMYNKWSRIALTAHLGVNVGQYSGPGGFNDLDMMEVGNGVLTEEEERSHFGLWALLKSPLIIGTNLATIKNSSLAVLLNAGVISVSQDSLGKAASYFQPKGQSAPTSTSLYPYLAGPLSDGVVFAMIALSSAATLSVNFSDVPGLGPGSYNWTELWTGKSGVGSSFSASLELHDMAMVKVLKSK